MTRFFDHFGIIAPYYDRLLARPESDPLPRLLRGQTGDRILDAGGGTGRNGVPLVAAGIVVVVCDVSLEMLRQARKKGLHVVLADVSRLPFADGAFDRILVVDAFHHFVWPSAAATQPSAARQMLRVLEPAGRIVIEEPDIRRRGVKWVALTERILLMRSRFLTPDALARLFAASGGRQVAQEEDNFSVWIVLEHNNSATRSTPAPT
jgi:demethylmenaquinone methyltransferase/2-methoxy-6-polyprenyl-1,4-benzoquinol methylase